MQPVPEVPAIQPVVLPDEHRVHADAAVAALCDEYVKTGHTVQSERPKFGPTVVVKVEYFPAAQAVQTKSPRFEEYLVAAALES